MAGFREQQGPARTPVYTCDSRKVGYICGQWFMRVDGTLVARITRYHIELPEATSSLSGSNLICPEESWEQ